MTEALTPTEKSKKQRVNTKNATKNFDYITIADRLRTVSWGNDSHPAIHPATQSPSYPPQCQIEIAMPINFFYNLQKQPYKCAEIKIIRTVDLTVCSL